MTNVRIFPPAYWAYCFTVVCWLAFLCLCVAGLYTFWKFRGSNCRLPLFLIFHHHAPVVAAAAAAAATNLAFDGRCELLYYWIRIYRTGLAWASRVGFVCASVCCKRSSLRSLPTAVWVNIIFYAHTSSKRNEFINLQSNINRNSSTKHLVRFGSSVESHQQIGK